MDRTRNTLLVITALCLAGALLVYAMVFAQQQELLHEVKENPLWAAHQLERQSYDFSLLLKELGEDPTDKTLAEQARLRFDVLYSRLSVVSHGLLGEVFRNLPRAGGEIDPLRELLHQIDSRLYSTLDAGVLGELDGLTRQLTETTNRILLDTLQYHVRSKVERRENLGRLVVYLGLLIGLVAVGAMLLVFTLVRQVREVRRSHAETLELAQKLDRTIDENARAERQQMAFREQLCEAFGSHLDTMAQRCAGLQQSPLDGAQRRDATVIEQSAEALKSLLDRAQELSRVQSEDFRLRDDVFNLRSLLEDLQRTYQMRAFEKGLSLRVELAEEAGGTYMGDAALLKRVLARLLDNALAHTQSGTIRVGVKAFLQSAESSDLLFEVEDSGPGLDGVDKARIFQAFNPARQEGVTAPDANLGLALCKGVVERMQGTIDADSVPGRGARFWFRIPLHRLAAQGPGGTAYGVACSLSGSGTV
ncbi:hypothetical protein GCM10011348_42480 [Marinobacterium nitratireducens]|uniref:histidine kinase n=1 Tax=Marinobacterium nitratireducens TaxID=518897 RepID=A0A918DY68_9GAMM|nr:HAMP domain-containing sensor histidine kinase [Marinobacterium nitratireducens]GGO88007.1 hypothetical protein GCM10011348_42480 [Marinobacterium nitratireducens]